MKVTLLYVAVNIAGFNANRTDCDREGWLIGHGIAYLGASLKAAGHEVDMVDLRHLGGWDDLGEIIRKNRAEVYGISIAPADHDSRIQVIYQVKSNAPKAKIIVGGLPPTLFPHEYNYPTIDTVVVGEGEVTFPKLLKNIKKLPRMITGEKPDLDKIPWADRELFDYTKELMFPFAPGEPTPSVTMLAGRGCPYQCTFCQPAENIIFGTPHRLRSAENVCAELQSLYDKYGFKGITFWDDTFTLSKKWVFNFCDVYERTGLNATIAACSRADIICNNEDMIERLAEVGVNWMTIGLESGSQRLLDLIKKGTTVEQNIEAAKICRKYGIKVFGTFILGLPTEKSMEAIETIEMIDKIQPNFAHPFWYVPIRGTKLYDFCKTNDLLIQDRNSISRTGVFKETIRNIDYDFLRNIMNERLLNHTGGK